MHGRWSVLFLLVLILLFGGLLFPGFASPDSGEYDYVDNNNSNVDGIAGKGGHSNFTAQQHGPDGIYDILTEENITTGETNFELDLEVQWTNTTYNLTNEQLCIYGGTMGAENLRVDAWNGSTWKNLLADLSTGWNNISVTDHLTSSTFTIRFKGENETTDTSQDAWELDATLLHTWESPVANFSYTPEQPYTDQAITFNASDSYDPDGYIVSYFWDFGDETNTTGMSVNHSYTEDGNYTVTLNVTDDDGFSDHTSKNITVLNRSPVAVFTESATTVATGEVIYFNASDSYDPDGSVVSYFWDFGDGTNGTGVTADHSYVDDGDYTVTLRVTDDDGATDNATASKTVLNRSPVASFTESAETVQTDELITFNASDSYDPDGVITSYFWDFGDGVNATGVVVDHAYGDDGNYTVTLTVTDDDAAKDNATSTKTVLNRSPVAMFTESAETVYTNETIYFNASQSYDADGYIVSYFWDFGDETNTTGMSVNHSYTEDGNYTVTLNVTDDDGAIGSAAATKTVLNRSPVAAFTWSPQSPIAGETVTFNASDSYDPDGKIVSYVWDFGDDNITTVNKAIVTHRYTAAGDYTVTLTVSDNDGLTDTTTDNISVQEITPVAIFTYSPDSPIVNQTITFNATESYDSNGNITSYIWDFGDETNTTTTDPLTTHLYSGLGNYTVTLTVTDNDNLTDSTTDTVEIRDYPQAAFTYSPTAPYMGDTITFNASSSEPQGGVITSYLWDFGDGTPTVNESDPITTHLYDTAGNYTVALTVTDSEGLSDNATCIVTVSQAPVAIFTYSPDSPIVNQTLTFNATESYDPNGKIMSYVWKFGDDNITTVSNSIITHVYRERGTYRVVLTVSDDDGYTDTTSTEVKVRECPAASFTYSPDSPIAGEIVDFNASSSTANGGEITSYSWDFGDGMNDTVANPITNHTYAAYGNYTVALTVMDSEGLNGTISKILGVREHPVAIFASTPLSPETGETVTFNASSSEPQGGVITSYLWDFGDGTPTVNESDPITTHNYTSVGNYTVTLTVADSEGLTDTTTSQVVVGKPPVATFTYSPDYPIVGDIVTFNASDSYDPDGNITSYSWDFGDGNTTAVTDPVVTHVYSGEGNLTVILTVGDNEGLNDTATQTIGVRDYPTAAFTHSPDYPVVGQPAAFNATPSSPNGGSITSYGWDFGDGNLTTVTDPIVTHVYSESGNHTVTLNVTDSEGLSNSVHEVVQVKQLPNASFLYSPLTPYVGDLVTFNGSQSYDPNGNITSYSWDFGDGTILNQTDPVASHTYDLNGNYTVQLMVMDNEGLNDTTSRNVTVRKAPVALFIFHPDSPIAGETISFNASESHDPNGVIANYTWDFGDGNTTTVTTPVVTHSYEKEGNYTTTLTVTDTEGYTDETHQMVTVRNHPISEFTYSPRKPLKTETVTFNASASQPRGGVITSYMWDFEDGPLVNTTDPITSHQFVAIGDYNVTLRVIDSEGLENWTSRVVRVVDYPTAEFTWSPSSPEAAEEITFNASESRANSGNITTYVWDFGDDSPTVTSSSPLYSHIYSQAQIYNVTLTVVNSDGMSSSITKAVTVFKAPPVASFNCIPESQVTGQPITLNASQSYDPDGWITGYHWNLGDGNLTSTTDPIITHTYETVGNYTVLLNVTDNDGLTASAQKELRITAYPTANFTWTPETAQSTEPITFNASMSKANGGLIANYTWDFGNGNTTTLTDSVITHTYDLYGDYTVTLTVLDSEDLSANKTHIVTITGCPPLANFSWQPSHPLINETVTFDASSSAPNGGVITFYRWDFGDGTPPQQRLLEPQITHSFTKPGNYQITLTVTDSEDLNDSISKIMTIGAPPDANFTYSPPDPQTYEAVTFNASTSSANGGVIIDYTWDFGDGNTTTVTDPVISHYFSTSGDFLVILNVTDSDGLWDTESETVSVAAAAKPNADFTWSPLSPYVNETITFNASKSAPNGGMITSYQWTFGDGNSITQSNPIANHSYPLEGNYTVTLNVTDSQGEWSTTLKTIGILPPSGPTADFLWDPSTPIANRTVTFDASNSTPGWNGTHHPPIVNYTWDFGNGNTTKVTKPEIEHTYSQAGNYTVTLTVTDAANQTGTISYIIEVLDLNKYDTNGDGVIDLKDVFRVALAYGSYPGHEAWDPVCDFNNDDTVDLKDYFAVALHYGEEL